MHFRETKSAYSKCWRIRNSDRRALVIFARAHTGALRSQPTVSARGGQNPGGGGSNARNGVLCFHRSRPRYHARTDPRRVARGCARERGLSDDAWTQFCFKPRGREGWQKDHAENPTGERGQRGTFAATTSIRRSHCPAVTCSDHALTSPSLGPPPRARFAVYIKLRG